MNCKTCGGSTTPKNTPRGQAFECNQENGDCYGPNGYATTTWAQTRNNNGGGGFQQRRAQQAPAQRPAANGADLSKWQTCLNCASRVFAGLQQGGAKEVIAFARELYAAKPTVARPPAPRVVAPEPELEEETEVF